jgi:hypothetical protein
VVFGQDLDVYAIALTESCAAPWRRQWEQWDRVSR